MLHTSVEEEKENFLQSVDALGNEEKMKKLNEFEIFLQEKTADNVPPELFSMHKKIINAYSFEIPNNMLNIKSTFTERKKLDGLRYLNCCDEYFLPKEYRLIEYFDEEDRTIASIDVFGILHTVDFYHEGKKFKYFWKLLEEFKKFDYTSYISCYFKEYLLKSNPEKVKWIQIETEFDKEAFIKKCYDEMKANIDSLTKMYELKIENLINLKKRDERILIERIENEMAIKLNNILTAITKSEWKYKNDRGVQYLIYDKQIETKYIKLDDEIVEIPIDKRVFYVKDLKIPINLNKITRAWCEKSFHPNISNDKSVCLGDLEGQNIINVIEKLPKELEMINMNSAYSGDALNAAKEIFAKYEKIEHVVWGD